MIEKLRKKLMLLFLCFTMLIFTAVFLILLSNAVSKARGFELEYVNNMADGIVDQVQSGEKIDEHTLSVYATNFNIWVCLSDGAVKKSSPECFTTSSDILVKSKKTLISSEGVTSNKGSGQESNRAIYLICGAEKEQYYEVEHTFFSSDTAYDLIVIYPQSTLWQTMRSYCIWYPALWLCVFLLMYLMSRMLIRKATTPLEAAMKSQKEFISSASHELKAPLSVIQINTEALSIDKGNVASQHKQKVILDECDLMSRLIQSLLAIASSDSGNWKMNKRETDVNTLLIEVWEAFNEPARKKNIRLNLDIKDHYPNVVCDKERIFQVLGILLDNAITYSAQGLSIEFGAKALPKQIAFYVKDHGPGIADKDKEKVFERFYSGDPSRTDKSHYGLGLSIAQEIVKLHQGAIFVRDTLNGGCTFEIRIPFEQGPVKS